MDRIDWHFPRLALAESYIDTLQIGLVNSMCCFAPRRKGKTEWLVNDVLPIAEKAGMRSVYVSMWENRDNPVRAFLHALAVAAEPRNLGERLKQTLKPDVKKAGVELDVKGALRVSAEFKEVPAPNPDLLTELPKAVDRLIEVARGKPVLVVVDEVQHLAKPEFHNFVAALRTALDIRKDKVKAIFTGSSRVRLQAMFESTKSPLFQFSQRVDFPDLDEQFVDFMADRFHQATKRTLLRKDAIAAFKATHATPGLFRDALQRLILEGGIDIRAKARELVAQSQSGAAYKATIADLPALDRAVLGLALNLGGSLYSKSAKTYLTKFLGVANVTNNEIQGSLNRLMRNQILYSPVRGIYEIEDPQMAAWYEKTASEEQGDEDLELIRKLC